jgi:hypothetical protein
VMNAVQQQELARRNLAQALGPRGRSFRRR